jgi:hypothetical protein
MNIHQKVFAHALKAVADVVSKREYEVLREQYETLKDEHSMLRDECDRVEDELSTVRRHKQEFFSLIERMEKQRDEWKEMFKRSSMQQMNALGMMESAIGRERRKLAYVIEKLNKYLAADGKPEIAAGFGLPDDHPVGESKRFVDFLEKLYREGVPEMFDRAPGVSRPAEIDGVRERDEALRKSP